ncbi:MAG: ribbon-helix-helix protein, CopG family [Myxococcota bacterium]
MKTAISLPDPLFERAERFARRLKKSRSEIYRDAVSEYLMRHDADEVTEALDAIAARAETRADAFVASAAHRLLRGEQW